MKIVEVNIEQPTWRDIVFYQDMRIVARVRPDKQETVAVALIEAYVDDRYRDKYLPDNAESRALLRVDHKRFAHEMLSMGFIRNIPEEYK